MGTCCQQPAHGMSADHPPLVIQVSGARKDCWPIWREHLVSCLIKRRSGTIHPRCRMPHSPFDELRDLLKPIPTNTQHSRFTTFYSWSAKQEQTRTVNVLPVGCISGSMWPKKSHFYCYAWEIWMGQLISVPHGTCKPWLRWSRCLRLL